MRTCINTSWSPSNALALVASCRALPYHRDLAVTLDPIPVLVTVHRDVPIRAVCRALTAAYTVILDHDLLVPLPKDRIDRTPNQTIRVRAGSTACGHQKILESQAVSNQPCFTIMSIGTCLGTLIASRAGF